MQYTKLFEDDEENLEIDILDDSFEDEDLDLDLDETLEENLSAIKHAIQNKLTCNIYYKGELNENVIQGNRKIEPYTLGVNKKGNLVVRAWILSGISKSGNLKKNVVPGWRLYRIDRINSIGITYNTFTYPRKGYNKEDKGMQEITLTAQF